MCNLGSANIRIGLAQQDTPLNVPHCIARRTTQVPKRSVQDQVTSLSEFPMIFLSFLNFLLFFPFWCSCLIPRLQRHSTWSVKGLMILLVKIYMINSVNYHSSFLTLVT